MFKGIFFSRDPGGTNAIIPIASKLGKEKGAQIFNFASSFAIPLWEQSGLDFTPLPDSVSREEIDSLLRKINPDFLFTGTSEDTTLEGNFWFSAKRQNIQTYSIIDHWISYQERYMVDGVFSPTDRVFTIDEDSKKEMISLGFSPEKVIVSGQPHFEKFYGYTSVYSQSQFCDQLNLPSKKIITFVSDIISLSFPSTVPGKPVLGFDEHTTLLTLLDELELIEGQANDFQVIIKLHPKESENNFSRSELGKKEIRTHILKGGNNQELIYHSDFVIGMFSMLLFEAYLMNKPVLSLQLNAVKPINFGENKIPIVVEPSNVRETLRKFLSNGIQQQPLPYMDSLQKIIEIVKGNLSIK